MMLNQEHEMLRLALDPTWHAPDHCYRQPQDLSRAPVRPDDELLSKLFMRCGVNERQPMETVVTEVCASCALCTLFWDSLQQLYVAEYVNLKSTNMECSAP